MKDFVLLILVLLIVLYFINLTNKNISSKFGGTLYRLNVNVVGPMLGSVRSSPGSINTRIDWGRNSYGDFDIGTQVTLTAIPDGGYNFAGWSGDASGNNSSTTITMNSDKYVTATFNQPIQQYYRLRINTNGTGSGIVISPSGSSSNTSLGDYGLFNSGTIITITAIASQSTDKWTGALKNIFAGWSGDASGNNSSTTITMNSDKYVTATFNLIQYRLTVYKITVGTGSGTVTVKNGNNTLTSNSDDYGLFDYNTVITLTATPDGGSVFKGWYYSTYDNFSSQSSVSIIMDNNKSITARFDKQQYRLNGYTNGTGSGNIMAKNGNINLLFAPNNWPYLDYDIGTVVTLRANPGSLSTFAGWSGSITSTSNPIDITMDDNKSIIATFNLIPFRMFVVKYGLGSGTVTSSPIGSDASTSSGNYGIFDPGTVVTITATPNGGSDFAGWELYNSDVILSTDNTYTITMDTPKTLVARFNKKQYTLTTSTSGGSGSGTVKVQRVTALGTDIQPSTSGNYGPFESFTQLVLTATPNLQNTFEGWSGDVLGTTTYPLTYPLTYITMDNNKSVTATFNKIQYALTINTNGGTGGGSVTTNLSSANNLFDIGTVVTLTAIPNLQSTFGGWSTNVTSTGKLTGTITMDSNKSVTAKFDIQKYKLNINKHTGGTGTGSVKVKNGITVLTGNSGDYGLVDKNAVVTLIATPDGGSVFAGWSGATSSPLNPINITMNSNKTIVLKFDKQKYILNLYTRGTGTGKVTVQYISSLGTDIQPGTLGNYGPFEPDTQLALTATPSGTSTFTSWSGDVSGRTTDRVIYIKMGKHKSITANFGKQEYRFIQ